MTLMKTNAELSHLKTDLIDLTNKSEGIFFIIQEMVRKVRAFLFSIVFLIAHSV